MSIRDMMEVLESRGPKFAGNHVFDVAQDWLDYGFSPTEADSWCEVGVWNPATAAEFQEAGLSPDGVRAAAERLVEAEQAEWTEEN